MLAQPIGTQKYSFFSLANLNKDCIPFKISCCYFFVLLFRVGFQREIFFACFIYHFFSFGARMFRENLNNCKRRASGRIFYFLNRNSRVALFLQPSIQLMAARTYRLVCQFSFLFRSRVQLVNEKQLPKKIAKENPFCKPVNHVY